MNPEQTSNWRYSTIETGITSALLALQEKKPVMYIAYDDTRAGGIHIMRAFFQPEQNNVAVEIPENGGQYSTMLHTLEIIAFSVKKMQDQGIPFNYPELEFWPRESIQSVRDQLDSQSLFTIPLTVNPSQTNVVVFHPEARSQHIDHEKVARGYYEYIQNGGLKSFPRHTMVVSYPREHPDFVSEKGDFKFYSGDHTQIMQNARLHNPKRLQWQ